MKPYNSISRDLTWEETIEVILEKTNSKNDKGFIDWLRTKEHLTYLFDYYAYKRAYFIVKSLRKDNDHVTLFTGVEGSGKSVFALQFCAMTSPTFSMKNVCFVAKEFIDGLRTAQPGDCFLLDEGAMFLFSREAMGKDNKRIVKLLNLVRQLNLHIVVCIPKFLDVDSYIRMHRVETLFNIDKPRKGYTAYSKPAIEILSVEGAKKKSISGLRVPYGTFWQGYWRHEYPVINDLSEEAYRTKKRNHLQEHLKVLGREVGEEETEPTTMVSVSEFRKIAPMDRHAVYEGIKNGSIPGVKLGKKYFIDGKYTKSLLNRPQQPPTSIYYKGTQTNDGETTVQSETQKNTTSA